MVSLRFEADALNDTIAELLRIREALTHRHDPEFRTLQDRVEALPDHTDAPMIVPLDDGAFVAAPPEEWTAILVEARRLGI